MAAKSINGSLLKIVFEKVTERVIELLSLSRSINNSEFDTHAIFLRTAYQHSSETDQEALAAVINSNDVLLSYVINTISSILTSQEGELGFVFWVDFGCRHIGSLISYLEGGGTRLPLTFCYLHTVYSIISWV